jgi:hypothetical protein
MTQRTEQCIDTTACHKRQPERSRLGVGGRVSRCHVDARSQRIGGGAAVATIALLM